MHNGMPRGLEHYPMYSRQYLRTLFEPILSFKLHYLRGFASPSTFLFMFLMPLLLNNKITEDKYVTIPTNTEKRDTVDFKFLCMLNAQVHRIF